MIEIEGVSAWYGPTQALFGAGLSVPSGSTVGLVGTNGAGKTTLVRSILGLIKTVGSVRVDGTEISATPTHQRTARHGISVVPEGRGMFSSLTVRENLEVGRGRLATVDLDMIGDSFQQLLPRLDEKVSKLSGGEQQMVALCRAFLRQPKFLILDEPSLGLAPVIVDRVYERVEAYKSAEMSILLIEQDVSRVREVCDHIYFLAAGSVLGDAPVADGNAVDALVGRTFAQS